MKGSFTQSTAACHGNYTPDREQDVLKSVARGLGTGILDLVRRWVREERASCLDLKVKKRK